MVLLTIPLEHFLVNFHAWYPKLYQCELAVTSRTCFTKLTKTYPTLHTGICWKCFLDRTALGNGWLFLRMKLRMALPSCGCCCCCYCQKNGLDDTNKHWWYLPNRTSPIPLRARAPFFSTFSSVPPVWWDHGRPTPWGQPPPLWRLTHCCNAAGAFSTPWRLIVRSRACIWGLTVLSPHLPLVFRSSDQYRQPTLLKWTVCSCRTALH